MADEALERAVQAGGKALAEAMGWGADGSDYGVARIVILAVWPEFELLRALVRALTASLRASNATTRTAQARAERAEALFREKNQ